MHVHSHRFVTINHPPVAVWVNVLGPITLWCTVASCPSYFFANPLNSEDLVLQIEGVLATLGWVLIGVIPLVFAFAPRMTLHVTRVLDAATMLWPMALIASHVTQKIRFGETNVDYLWECPIFGFIVFIFPVASIRLHRVHEKKHTDQVR